MKAYTDLQQSKKLAEILSLETADMVLLHEEPYETSDSKFDGIHQVLCVPFNKYDKSWKQKYKNISYFPCWSLAALLETLPRVYKLKPLLDLEENSIMYSGTYIDVTADNPVDACVEMLLKLNTKVNSL